jgi:hypothetical protein
VRVSTPRVNHSGWVRKMPSEQTPIQPLEVVRSELRRRKAHLAPHRTLSLEHHLVNTCNILTSWRQPPHVQYAGLVHSVYSTDTFRHRTFTLDERDRVRELVGEAAERLAYLYCVIDRRELLSAVRSSLSTPDVFEVTNRLDGEPVAISRGDAGGLVVVYMANAVEQSCRRDLSPSTWLSNVSLRGLDARRLAEVIPTVFDGCTTVVSQTDETRLLSGYQRLVARFGGVNDSTVGRDDLGGLPGSAWPFVAEPLVWMGFDAIARGRPDEAGVCGGMAADRLRQWGSPWDKRLTLGQWLELCAALRDLGHADELAFLTRRIAATESVSPQRLYYEVARAGLLGGDTRTGTRTSSVVPLTAAGRNGCSAERPNEAAEPPLPPRFARHLAKLRDREKPRMGKYPGLSSIPWHEPHRFQLVRDLEAIAGEVADEVHAFAGKGFHEEAEKIGRSGRWSVLFLYERGRKNEDNCSRCPQTAAAIEANRTVRSQGGLIYFSRLDPHTLVAPHRGPTNMRLRCHLGIDVPEDCGLRVGGVTRTWEERRCLVFDDSFTHEVWNRSNQPRLVLVVDLWHPDLTDDEVTLLSGLHRYASTTGTRLARYWERNRAAAVADSEIGPGMPCPVGE